MKVSILHNETYGHRFWQYEPGDTLVEAYTYQRYEREDLDGPALLEDIFRENNAVEGWEYPILFQKRSLSAGDVVGINEKHWACEPTGWKEVLL